MKLKTLNMNDFPLLRLLLSLLTISDRTKLIAYVLAQLVLSILDVMGIALLALLVSLGTNSTSILESSGFLFAAFRSSGALDISLGNLVVLIGIASILILIARTLLSLLALQRVTKFLSYRSSVTTGVLIQKVFSRSLTQLQSRSIHLNVSILTGGVNRLYFNIILRSLMMITDSMMIFVMILALFLFNPFIAFLSTVIFGSVGIILYFVMQKRASLSSKLQWELTVKSNEDIFQVLSTFRETFVKNRLFYFGAQIKKTRLEIAHSQALLNYLPLISKYAFETVVTVSAILIALLEFRFGDSKTAIASLAIFLGAATRIAPAALRIQQSAIDLKAGIHGIEPVIEFMEELHLVNVIPYTDDELDTSHAGFFPSIKLQNVVFSYPGSDRPALNDVSLELEANKVYAVVGPSGGGKSTLIDLMLGLLEPVSGTVQISGMRPREAMQKWQGAIGYVPQDVVIINSSIAENIHLGYPANDQTSKLVTEALAHAQLTELIYELPNGVDSQVGDRGSKLSGGQRQRLGIARALFSKPKLLILDEATSSLDGLTEENVASSIFQSADITVLTIAHRLSTIEKADYIIYLNAGRVECVGTFEEVRGLVADFETQISLMGPKR